MKICIDAGHCKLTPGKRAFDGSFFEWEFNYDVANRIKKLLDSYDIDSYVQYIEDSNPKSELNARIKAINKEKPILVVSIHANAFGTSWNNANGWEIFCSEPNNKDSKGTKLAELIQKHSKALGLTNRGIKDAHGVAGIVVSTKSPAVLIEHGFYTNQTELAKLKSDSFREQCAIADAKGILEYLGIEWKEQEEEEMIYATFKDLPKWYQEGVGYFIKNGDLNDGTPLDGQIDQNFKINLAESTARALQIQYNAFVRLKLI